MLPRFWSMMLVVALSSCGAKDASLPQRGGSETRGATAATLDLRSEAIHQGGAIPARYTCDGENAAPPLHWSDPPARTRSLALFLDDPDAPGGTFRHWGVYDIPPSARAIGGGRPIGRELTNDFGTRGYAGPCPPRSHGPHHYHFTLFAIGTDRLNSNGPATIAAFETAAQRSAIAKGELVAVYQRQ